MKGLSHTHICNPFSLQTLLPSRLPHNIEQRSLCDPGGPCRLSILSIAVCTWSEVKVAQSCPILCHPMDYPVCGSLQARILEWVAFAFSQGSSQHRDRTQVSHVAGRFFTSWATREGQCVPVHPKLSNHPFPPSLPLATTSQTHGFLLTTVPGVPMGLAMEPKPHQTLQVSNSWPGSASWFHSKTTAKGNRDSKINWKRLVAEKFPVGTLGGGRGLFYSS